jgi:hypothetical protein
MINIAKEYENSKGTEDIPKSNVKEKIAGLVQIEDGVTDVKPIQLEIDENFQQDEDVHRMQDTLADRYHD